MPYVKWKKGPSTDLTPDDNLPVGRNVLTLTNVKESANYTCTAASDLGIIEVTTMVKVQGSYHRIAVLASNNARNNTVVVSYRVRTRTVIARGVVSHRIAPYRDGSKSRVNPREIAPATYRTYVT